MTPVVEARGLTRHFAAGGGLLSRRRGAVRAIDGVSFAIDPGRTLGLDGESADGSTARTGPRLSLHRARSRGRRPHEPHDRGHVPGHVEIGDAATVARTPRHPYTQALFVAALPSSPDETREEIVVAGEVPRPLNPPSGCRLHPRCPHVMERANRSATAPFDTAR